MEELYRKIIILIAKKEKELNELSKRSNKNLKDMVDEVYLKGELSSLAEVLNMISKI